MKFHLRWSGRGIGRGFQEPPVKFGLLSLQQEPKATYYLVWQQSVANSNIIAQQYTVAKNLLSSFMEGCTGGHKPLKDQYTLIEQSLYTLIEQSCVL